jgi:hypothetical protein
MPQKSVLSDLTVSTGLSRRYVLAHFGRLTIAVHLRIRAPFGAYSETRRNQDASRPAQRDGRALSPRHAIAEEWQILRGWRCPAESAYRLDDI